jgi:hypothetical protein
MGMTRTIVVVSLALLLGYALYILGVYRPLVEAREHEQAYTAALTEGVPAYSSQFYPNLRFSDSRIVYAFGPACDETQRARVHRALSFLDRDTGLVFVEGTSPMLSITCALTPTPEKAASYFVAGEGGPTSILNVSSFYIIQHASVSLYRPERCDTPTIALHELLHAFGFGHTATSTSILYPLTNCDQTIDTNILQELRRLYAIPPLPDITFVSAGANSTRTRLSFHVVVANIGLAPLTNATLIVETPDFKQTFALEDVALGGQKALSVTQLRLTSPLKTLSFRIETKEQELSLANNNITLSFSEENV